MVIVPAISHGSNKDKYRGRTLKNRLPGIFFNTLLFKLSGDLLRNLTCQPP